MRELVKGQRVRATRELRSPIGGGIDLVAEGTEGTRAGVIQVASSSTLLLTTPSEYFVTPTTARSGSVPIQATREPST
jgi:hypothetical protein